MRTNELDHLENHVLDFKSSGMDCAKSRCPNNKIFKLDISSNFLSNFLFQRVKLFLVQISYYYQIFLLAPYSKLCVIRFSRKNHSPKLITLLIVGNKTIYIHRRNCKLFQYPPPKLPLSSTIKRLQGLATKKLYRLASN